MANVPYVTGNLYKIGDSIAESAKKDKTGHSEEESKKTTSEDAVQTAAYQEKYKEYQRLQHDIQMRFAENMETISAEMKLYSARADELKTILDGLNEIQNRIQNLSEPSPKDENFRKTLRDTVAEYETARLEIIRLCSNAKGSALHQGINHAGTAFDMEKIPSGTLFRKGFFFFLPLGIVLFLCSLILAAAFVLAWKVAL